MSLQSPCLYCPSPESSVEEVISSALGCKESIRFGVCRVCNNAFGHSFEGSFVNGLALFRNFFKIPNSDGVVPSVRLKGKIGSEEISFWMTGDGRAEVPPQLLDAEDTGTDYGRKFRVFDKARERRIERDLRSKHPDLDWNRLQEVKTKVVFDAQPDFDPQILCSPNANRSIVKYAVNLFVHQYDYAWARDKCSSLVAYVKGEQSVVRAGILWEPDLLRRLPFAPPKHLFVLVCDSRNRSIAVLMYLFSLLP